MPISRPECNSSRPQAGFTLIEVLIAITLLALMSIAIFQVTVNSFNVNFKLGTESTDYTATILSLQVVETDLAQIYTPYLDLNAKGDGSEQPSDFWSPIIKTDGSRRSRLVGTGEKISFVNSGNRRLEEDATQSEFQKVTWQIERNATGAYSLYRATDWDAFRTEDATARKPSRVALLENLSSAKFTYYRQSNKTWEDAWDSEGAFAKPEERWPALISLKITLPDPTNTANQLQWEVIAKPNMSPNNLPKPTAVTP